jgi:mono/diheme cytochrome c family protein
MKRLAHPTICHPERSEGPLSSPRHLRLEEEFQPLLWLRSYRPVRNLFGSSLTLVLLALSIFTGCDVQRRKSDAELGLNPQQVAGRKIYDSHCDRCHEPYSTRGKKGPGLQGVFQRPYLPISGLPANDERVRDIIRLGRKEMPGYSQTLTQQYIQDLLAYMHTL